MELIKTSSILFVFFIITSCSSGISRTGYSVDKKAEELSSGCHFSIKHQAKFNEKSIVKLGAIKAFDTQFSVECDEAYVLDKFAREACMLGADVINITEEKHPNFWSTCYRAKAEFIQFKDRKLAESNVSDPQYTQELIIERSKETAKRTKIAIQAGVMGGLLGGLLVQ